MSSLRKNVASQNITFQLIKAADGTAVTAGGAGNVSKDGGAQAACTGSFTHLGTGQWLYVPAQAETNATAVGFQFTGTGAINVNLHFFTDNWDTSQAVLTSGSGAAQIAVNGSGAVSTVTTVTNQLTAAAIATGVWQDATAGDFTTASSIGKSLYTSGAVPGAAGGHFIAGTNAATTITTSLTTTFTGNLTGSVGSVTGAVGSVTGAVGSVTGNVGGNVVGSVASVTARVTANTDQLAGQTVTAAAGVTFPTSVASPTNITAGTITTTTNLTNAPTAGDFTATMKTSLNAATPASVVGAVGSVTGNVGGNVTGSVGSVVGAVGSVVGNVGGSVASVTAAVTVDGTSPLTEAYPTKTGALTLASSLYSINEQLANRTTAGTTITVLKRDQTTTAMTFTIDDPVDTTSIKQA